MLVLAWIGLIWMIINVGFAIDVISKEKSIGTMIGAFIATFLYLTIAIFFICYISK